MTKQELIQQAYGDSYEKLKSQIDENGYLNCGFCVNGYVDVIDYLSELEIDYYSGDYHNSDQYGEGIGYWRPIQLQGIETNNGWIKIESEKDLPKEEGKYYCICTFDEQIKQYTYPDNKFTIEVNNNWWLKYITHYQPIIKPKPPLY